MKDFTDCTQLVKNRRTHSIYTRTMEVIVEVRIENSSLNEVTKVRTQDLQDLVKSIIKRQ